MNPLIYIAIGAIIVVGVFVYFAINKPEKLDNAEQKVRDIKFPGGH